MRSKKKTTFGREKPILSKIDQNAGICLRYGGPIQKSRGEQAKMIPFFGL